MIMTTENHYKLTLMQKMSVGISFWEKVIRNFGLDKIPVDSRELTLGEISCLRTVDEPRKSSAFKSAQADLARSHGACPMVCHPQNQANTPPSSDLSLASNASLSPMPSALRF